MEENVGIIWHRLLGKMVDNKNQSFKVELGDVSRSLAIVFRALGQNGELQIEPSHARKIHRRRSMLQRVAGSHQYELSAWYHDDILFLPPEISTFNSESLNRDLYFWLTAMAASNQTVANSGKTWFYRNQLLVKDVLAKFPGMRGRYNRLLQAVLEARPPLSQLSSDECRQEEAVQKALKEPGSVESCPPAKYAPTAVPIWLVPSQRGLSDNRNHLDDDDDSEPESSESQQKQSKNKRQQAERVDMPDGKSGLVVVRMENIFSWAEFVNVDRSTEDDDDPNAEKTAEDMDHLSLARDKKSTASKINFDLDLPAAAYDDAVIREGITYPEWNYKKQHLVKEQSQIIEMVADNAQDCELPIRLLPAAKKVRRIFEALAPVRTWFRGEHDGSELDLDAIVQFSADRLQKTRHAEQGLFRQFRHGTRDLSTLLLADLSLSTDAAVNNDARVIDVIRDSLFLFSEALIRTGDRFALYGFSSKKRQHVRFHQIKAFDESLNGMIRGRIDAIKPGFYTRMGAAIRHSAHLLEQQPAAQQILLILTDGKPNDLDHYEGRYGIEDTRHAIMEAKAAGLHPFCITIDQEGSDYLPHIFGPNGFAVINKPEELPSKLPMLYAQLTQI